MSRSDPTRGRGRARPPAGAPAKRRARRAEQARTPYAANWRAVLMADGALGVVVLLVGVVVLFAVNVWAGAGVGAFGVTYVVLVVRRYHYWRGLRREAGLDS